MGQTIQNLAKRKLPEKAIFNNRFVVEACESIHIHYRNLRINLSLPDWRELGRGLADSFARWLKKGMPIGNHTELCRKKIAQFPKNDELQINLNKNLYAPNEGRIFSEGADLYDKTYIHLKLRDLRIELTEDEFLTLAEATAEAKEALDAINSSSDSSLQAN